MSRIFEKAYAKLNLTLDVTGKRDDGFHDMRMVMQTVSLCDDVTLTLRDDGKINVFSDLSYLPCDERNIAYKAARAFFHQAGRPGLGADIALTKRIPVCAGMGGGSSDAAAVLRALNAVLGHLMSGGELEMLGAELGSDVPFCVHGGTSLAEGRGELLKVLAPLPLCYIVICKPEFSISTPLLFSKLDLSKVRYHPDTQGLVSALEGTNLHGVSKRMFNVFEEVLPPTTDAVAEIKGLLLDKGALGAVMTGTGSAVFGIFDIEEKASVAFIDLKKRYRNVFIALPQKRLNL